MMFTTLKTKKNLNIAASLAACFIVAAFFVSCGSKQTTSTNASTGPICEKNWAFEVVEHKNFKDLGNYVIELPDYTDASIEEKGLAVLNAKSDNLKRPGGGCTAMIKRNSKGEVIIGRNMDLDISQCPAFVYKTTFGKYKNFCVTYIPNGYPSYADIQKQDELDEILLSMIPYNATDCMNEKGLYIEANLRERNDHLLCYGLHSTHGEKTRADGKPWSELRAYTLTVPQLVSQNCATVKEAVEFIKNSYDWYTIASSGGGYTMINMAFIIGDATGEYGLIEIAQDEVNYIPYQYGQANYYITPKWAALEPCGPGYGRLAKVSEVIGTPESLDEMMDAMKPIMWRNETLWLGYSKRVADEKHQHPYNQIVFQDDKGNASLDWRSEYVFQYPVLDDGRLLVPAQLYEYAQKSDYDPMIKQYFDDAIKTGRLIIDNGSIKFNVKGQQLNLTQLTAKYAEYTMSTEPEKRAELQPYEDEYRRITRNMNNLWLHNDDNFEAVKAACYANMHIRYNDNGEFDLNSMSKYEKLCAFYGMGMEKDEKPLRDAADIWTTSLNVGANCAQKEMKIRFWENDEIIYHVKF